MLNYQRVYFYPQTQRQESRKPGKYGGKHHDSHILQKKSLILGRDFRESRTKKPLTFFSKTKARTPNFRR